MGEKIEFTGERFMCGASDLNILAQRHYVPYEFSTPFINGKTVLDLGCGEGYGAAYLAGKARQVIGTDIDKSIIVYAGEKYKKDNLSFEVMDVTKLDFLDKTFDVIVSSHVIEHIKEMKKCLQEIKRVLKGNGICIFATPNRKPRLKPKQKPFNIYHVHEFDWQELENLLREYFNNVRVYGIEASEKAFEFEMQRIHPDTAYDRFVNLLTTLDILKVRRLPLVKLLTRGAADFFAEKSKKAVKESKDYIPASAIGKEDFKIVNFETEKVLDLLAVCGDG